MRFLIVLALLPALAGSCARETGRKTSAEPASATAVRNEAFGITAEKPEDWYALSKEMQDALAGGSAKIVTEGKDAVAGAIEAGMARTTQIFGIYKYEPGSPVEVNPGVVAIAENVSFAPGVKTGSDYFYQFRKLAAQTNAKYEFKDETTAKIGGKDFARLDVTMSILGTTADQTYYAARLGDDVIVFIQSYRSDADRADTDAIVKSIRFD